TQLVSELKAQEDPRMFGRGEIFEKFPYSEDKMRGYYERFMGGEKFYAGWVEKTDYEKEPIEE
ncbi:MAG: heparan N-sulfatase, partial [Planctomycetota bacterium]